MNFVQQMKAKVLAGGEITLEEAVQLYQTPDAEELYAAANEIREHFAGQRGELCSIMAAKTGACPEDCQFCAQSAHYATGVVPAPLVKEEEALSLARQRERQGVHRFSLVTSGRRLSAAEFTAILRIYRTLRQETGISLCASLGEITPDEALSLKEAGVTRYHHNLEACRSFFPRICSTHTYDDRLRTIAAVRQAGLELCCGGIIGLGESLAERFMLAMEIKATGAVSVPVNVLNPIPGTPLADRPILPPEEVLRTMAVFRFILPRAFIRFAGGRPLLGNAFARGFSAGVNATITGDYLTTPGLQVEDDRIIMTHAGLLL